MLNFLYVGLGGALGAVSRLGINEIFERISFTSFPLSTLLINVFCCFFNREIDLLNKKSIF